MSNSNNVFRFEEYKVEKKSVEEIVSEDSKYDLILKRFDALEDRISPSENILLAKPKKEPDRVRIYGLFISTIFSGVALCLMFLSLAGNITVSWQFFASIAFASGGLASACLLILLGVDHEQYE